MAYTEEQKMYLLLQLLEEIMRDIQRFLRDVDPKWDDYK